MKTKWLYHGRWINVDPKPSLPRRINPMYTTSTGHRICAICGDTVLLPYFYAICGKHTYIPVDCSKQPDLGHIDMESLANMLGIYSRGGGPTGIYYDYQPEIIDHPPLKDDEVALNSEFSHDSLPLLIALVVERLHNLNYRNNEHTKKITITNELKSLGSSSAPLNKASSSKPTEPTARTGINSERNKHEQTNTRTTRTT